MCVCVCSLVPRLPFQLSVACSTGKATELEGKPGNEASVCVCEHIYVSSFICLCMCVCVLHVTTATVESLAR